MKINLDKYKKAIKWSLGVFLVCFLSVSIYIYRNTYIKEIKSLIKDKNELQDSLMIIKSGVNPEYNHEQMLETLESLETYKRKFDSVINSVKYEKENIDFSVLSIDSNIIILSRNLSKED